MTGKLGCRVFQTGMKIGNYFLGYRMPEYVSGPGSIRQLPALLQAAQGRKAGKTGQTGKAGKAAPTGKTGKATLKGKPAKALLVTGRHIRKSAFFQAITADMDAAGIAYAVFSDLSPNPTDRDVEKGFAYYREQGCTCLVAIGGGGPMDLAKAIGAKSTHPGWPVKKFQGVLKVGRGMPLLIAVPTTAGTGSETTVAAVITEEETHHKASINDPHLIPAYAILDPELTRDLPPQTTATTGMDALCHAVEAFTNQRYNTPLEDHLAKDAVRLIHKSLLRAYEEGTDLDARQDMQLAAFYAGRAFTRGCVGYVHAVGHTLGGLYNVPHGLAMAVILPHVMRQYGKAVYPRLAQLADVCGLPGSDAKEKALRFIAWIEEMNEKMGIPKGFSVIREEDIPQMIAWAEAEANPLYPTPVTWGEKDFRKLIASIREDV
ncbi:MAG: iron-containing alcohol dehydrogenase [Firmicutes bacterium]|nr:iron-containing alcohol dehydrogenase [Bacillota bacterium]